MKHAILVPFSALALSFWKPAVAATETNGPVATHHKRESAFNPAPAKIPTGVTLPVEDQQRMKQMFRPAQLFQDQSPPPAPNYDSPDTWAALPDRKDDADVAPANTKYPEAQKDAAVDVYSEDKISRCEALFSYSCIVLGIGLLLLGRMRELQKEWA